MIIVTGGVTARPATFEALLEACVEHSTRSRAEPGCILYTVHVDTENPRHLFFYEQWEDATSLKAHLAREDLAAFVKEAQELAAEGDRTFFYAAAAVRRSAILA